MPKTTKTAAGKVRPKTRSLEKRFPKKILITGGTGFLGTHIVRQLLNAGEKGLRVMASSVPEWMKDAGVEAAEGSVAEPDLLVDVRDLSDGWHPQLFRVFGGSLMAPAFVAGAFEGFQHLLIKRHG